MDKLAKRIKRNRQNQGKRLSAGHGILSAFFKEKCRLFVRLLLLGQVPLLFLREFDEAEKFLELHTKNDTEKNQGQAWKLLTKIYVRRQDKEKAASSLQEASEPSMAGNVAEGRVCPADRPVGRNPRGRQCRGRENP